MRLKVFSCEALRRQVRAAAARSRNLADVEFLPMEFADGRAPEPLRFLQAAVNQASAGQYDAILLAWTRCGAVAAGLESRIVPIVFPRWRGHPGLRTAPRPFCFRTSRWAEGERIDGDKIRVAVIRAAGNSWPEQCDTWCELIYAAGGPPPNAAEPPDPDAEDALDPGFFDRLLSGEWDEAEFLVLPPGWRLKASDDGEAVEREPIA